MTLVRILKILAALSVTTYILSLTSSSVNYIDKESISINTSNSDTQTSTTKVPVQTTTIFTTSVIVTEPEEILGIEDQEPNLKEETSDFETEEVIEQLEETLVDEIISEEAGAAEIEKAEEEYLEKNMEALALTTDYLNFRSAPDASSEKLELIPINSQVKILNFALVNEFYFCEYNGNYGYLHSDYLQLKEMSFFANKDTEVFINSNTINFKKGEKLEAYVASNGIIDKNTLSYITYNVEDFYTYSEYVNSIIDTCELSLLTEFSTYYSYEERYLTKGYNIELCSSEINSSIIPAGENFNWFEIVGNTGKAEGYQIANIYSNGQVEQGYGGGVCQVASTLYNCALNLDMEIIERHAHGLPVYYVDYYSGKDATVGDIGGPNLIIKNNLGCDILLKAYTTYIPENDITTQGMVTIEVYSISY